MTFSETSRMIRAICNSVRDQALEHSSRFPEHWGKAEIRAYITLAHTDYQLNLTPEQRAEVATLWANNR